MKKSMVLRNIRLLFSLSVAVLLTAACGDTPFNPADEGTEVPPGRLIAFSTGTDTRAAQLANLRGKDFGVKAFILNNLWASAGYNARPDGAWNDVRVGCDASGICTYTPRQFWTDNKYYSFFGFYPYTDDPAITVSDANNESTPYLEYRPSADDATLHRDVMVASMLDCTAISTGQVRMQFSHVLFCVNIAVNNYNDEAIRLENVNCSFTSDLYGNYKINLDKSAPVASGTMSGASYSMATTATVSNTSATGAANITDTDKFLMLIPQTGLKGKISFRLTQGGQTVEKTIPFEDNETDFRAGYRYTFTLYFVGDAIHFRVVPSNEWTDNDSDIEFD